MGREEQTEEREVLDSISLTKSQVSIYIYYGLTTFVADSYQISQKPLTGSR